jgi:class 3 adenylate cyclase
LQEARKRAENHVYRTYPLDLPEETRAVTDTGMRQRLAAILAADAVGDSRLMATDERATVLALDAARAVFRRLIESNQGRVVDMAGDSVEASAGGRCRRHSAPRVIPTVRADEPHVVAGLVGQHPPAVYLLL